MFVGGVEQVPFKEAPGEYRWHLGHLPYRVIFPKKGNISATPRILGRGRGEYSAARVCNPDRDERSFSSENMVTEMHCHLEGWKWSVRWIPSHSESGFKFVVAKTMPYQLLSEEQTLVSSSESHLWSARLLYNNLERFAGILVGFVIMNIFRGRNYGSQVQVAGQPLTAPRRNTMTQTRLCLSSWTHTESDSFPVLPSLTVVPNDLERLVV